MYLRNVIGDFMKTRLSILLLIILTACNSRLSGNTIENTQADSSTIKSNPQRQDTKDIRIDTLQINKQQYVQTLKDNKFNCLLSMQGDTIVKSENYYSRVDFLDIDEDGYMDIRVFAFSNTPNQCDNYLFDREIKTFKLIANCYFDIQKIRGTNFFYSYDRTGCSDMNWESYLSKIENYKLVNYGYIYGQGCDFEIKDNPQVIEIYTIGDSDKDKKKLIQSLPYLKHIPKFDNKWEFIEKYWTQNFKTFDR